MKRFTQLLQLMHRPREITPEHVSELHGLVKKYPYFQIGYSLLAKAAHDQNPDTATQSIQLASIYATDRSCLKALLENTSPSPVSLPKTNGQPYPEASTEKASAVQNSPVKNVESINEHIDKLREKSKRPLTNPKSIEQYQLIQQFVQKGMPFKPQPLQKPLGEAPVSVDFTQESTKFNDNLGTESLAKILSQQGKVQRAIEIYEQLALKFPDKSAYFASLIQELKS